MLGDNQVWCIFKLIGTVPVILVTCLLLDQFWSRESGAKEHLKIVQYHNMTGIYNTDLNYISYSLQIGASTCNSKPGLFNCAMEIRTSSRRFQIKERNDGWYSFRCKKKCVLRFPLRICLWYWETWRFRGFGFGFRDRAGVGGWRRGCWWVQFVHFI